MVIVDSTDVMLTLSACLNTVNLPLYVKHKMRKVWQEELIMAEKRSVQTTGGGGGGGGGGIVDTGLTAGSQNMCSIA